MESFETEINNGICYGVSRRGTYSLILCDDLRFYLDNSSLIKSSEKQKTSNKKNI